MHNTQPVSKLFLLKTEKFVTKREVGRVGRYHNVWENVFSAYISAGITSLLIYYRITFIGWFYKIRDSKQTLMSNVLFLTCRTYKGKTVVSNINASVQNKCLSIGTQVPKRKFNSIMFNLLDSYRYLLAADSRVNVCLATYRQVVWGGRTKGGREQAS